MPAEDKPDQVKFQAKIDDWVCIKKGKFDENTDDIQAAKLLASIYDSFNRKIWEYVGTEVDLEELDQIAYDVTGAEYDEDKDEYRIEGRVTNDQIAEAMQAVKSKVPRMIDIEHDELRQVAKTYVTRKVLDLLKIRIDPNPKKLKKFVEKKRKGIVD